MIRQIVPLFFTMDIPATRRTADARPGKYPDELLDAHVFIADADALCAEYSAPGRGIHPRARNHAVGFA